MSWATQPTYPPSTIGTWASETTAEGKVNWLTGAPYTPGGSAPVVVNVGTFTTQRTTGGNAVFA